MTAAAPSRAGSEARRRCGRNRPPPSRRRRALTPPRTGRGRRSRRRCPARWPSPADSVRYRSRRPSAGCRRMGVRPVVSPPSPDRPASPPRSGGRGAKGGASPSGGRRPADRYAKVTARRTDSARPAPRGSSRFTTPTPSSGSISNSRRLAAKYDSMSRWKSRWSRVRLVKTAAANRIWSTRLQRQRVGRHLHRRRPAAGVDHLSRGTAAGRPTRAWCARPRSPRRRGRRRSSQSGRCEGRRRRGSPERR